MSWLLVAGCASLERSLVKDIVDTGKVRLNRCEVEGFEYGGVDSALDGGQVLKLLMIHGVGTHHPGYSMRLQENLADNIGFNVVSRLPKTSLCLILPTAKPKSAICVLPIGKTRQAANGCCFTN